MGLKNIPPPIPTIPDTNPKIIPIGMEKNKGRDLYIFEWFPYDLKLNNKSKPATASTMNKIISNIFENIGCDSEFSGGYPGWEPNLNSATLKEVKDSYITLFSSEPKVNVIHAGLECGIIGSHYPEMDMISFGPTILGAHSPDEKASISSTQKFWRFFREILSNIPEKVN